MDGEESLERNRLDGMEIALKMRRKKATGN